MQPHGGDLDFKRLLPRFRAVSFGLVFVTSQGRMRTATLSALVLCLAALATPVLAQPPGSNPGLPPSATATGLAPQKITDMAGESLLVPSKAAAATASAERKRPACQPLVCSPLVLLSPSVRYCHSARPAGPVQLQ